MCKLSRNLSSLITFFLIVLFLSPTATAFEKGKSPMRNVNFEFFVASERGNCPRALILLGEGADPDFGQPKPGFPIIFFSAKGKTECVKATLDAGADVHAVDYKGFTALVASIFWDSGYETTKLLLENGAEDEINQGEVQRRMWGGGKEQEEKKEKAEEEEEDEEEKEKREETNATKQTLNRQCS